MERSSEKKRYIFDTSALISLGIIKLIDNVSKIAEIIITPSVIKELEEFAKFDDKYGKVSKEVLKQQNSTYL
jgi:predicted PilT family ATPase|tara:strand:- start:583 stop:798 length:216 start_codon:yes stop_codon:yes gene_type:complete